MEASNLRAAVDAAAGALRFLLTTPLGLGLSAAGLVAYAALRLWAALRARALACKAARERLGAAEGCFIALKELYALGLGLVAALPGLAALLLSSLALVTLSDGLAKFDEARANAERIRELSAVLRNLEGRRRVMDVRALSSSDGKLTLELSYYDPAQPGRPAAAETVVIAGSDVYFDAIVCNFEYAEIAQGRRVNIAIPYRIFSELVPQAEGLALGARGPDGVPYAFGRADEEIYGIAPEAYRARLTELVALMDDEAAGRRAGVVRSVYGSAPHRLIKAGDRFTIWVEQSGGLTIKESFSF